MRRLAGPLRAAVALIGIAACTAPDTDAAPPASGDAITFRIVTADRHPISPLIYGANFATDSGAWGGTIPPAVTLNRFGGNRLSAYNWELNVSNAGRDYRYQNDRLLAGGDTVGGAVLRRLRATVARRAAFLPTVPMLPFVAGDNCGCATDTAAATWPARMAAHFRRNAPTRGGDAPLPTVPDTSDGVVYEDEFVRWLQAARQRVVRDAARRAPRRVGDPGADGPGPLLLSLDNEPDLWHDTHKEVQSDLGDGSSQPRLLTYDAFVDTTIAFARAIKRVAPEAVVFGPVVATYTGFLTLGRHPHPDPHYGSWQERPFLAVYLDRLRAAGAREGRRLVDVLDVHWYPETGVGVQRVNDDRAPETPELAAARVQAPRSLWDSTYDEESWVSKTAGGPVRLLPRLREMVAAHYPGTRLAVTEYYFGRAGDITGGIAQADVLGIFGREGVWAAALWPQAAVQGRPYDGDGRLAYAYAFAAFRMFRDYDGVGGRFGDVGVRAMTSAPGVSSVYGSLDAAGRLVIVAINKQPYPRPVRLAIVDPLPFARMTPYVIAGGIASPVRGEERALPAGQPIVYTMPPLSVSTLVLAR